MIEPDANVAEVRRLSRLYAALGHVTQAIMRLDSRDALLARVCRVLVDEGGFGMAWIGWHDPRSHRLIPVAHAGDETGYLQTIEVYADDRPEGRGPSGIAFRDAKPYICRDISADPHTLPWRGELERRGFRSSAVLPIRAAGVVCATLSVYADQPDVFRDQEVALLTETAADISFALDNLAHQEERRRAEAVVKQYVAIVESTDDAIISIELDGTIVTWNRGAEEMFGYPAAEIIGRSNATLIPPAQAAEEASLRARIAAGEGLTQFETVRRRSSGEAFPVSITYSPIVDASHRVVGISKIVRDISARRDVEETAERERRFANNVIEALPGILYLYTEQGQFLRWNHNFEVVSGYTGLEIAGMHPLDFFAPSEKALLQERIGDVFARGESTVEAEFLSKDGMSTPYFFTGKRIAFEGMTCLVGVGLDIAERKRAERAVQQSEARFRSTLDGILEGCQLLSFDWRYLYLNDAAAQQNRRPNAELLGNRMPDMWPGIEGSDVFALLRRCMHERIAVHNETCFTFPDGSSAWFDVRAQPVPEGVFVLSIDISERKRAELALRELNDSLERKIAERTADLDAARVRAESADRLKSTFLATMSHELRTPLNSIIGFTGIILQGLAGPLNAEQEKQLGMVRGSARHLLELINDVLDLSKIEAGQLEVHPAPFDLAASIDRVVATVKPLADKKGLAIETVVPTALAPFTSDRRRVDQILLNLVNNAIKFTERGTITVTVTVEPAAVDIAVADTGIGIAEADLARLFQPFSQIDTGLQRQHEGTGLGLAICRRLTELLGGTIRAASTAGRGSIFTVSLPIGKGSP